MPDYDDGFDEWYADYQADTSEDKPETVHDVIASIISGGNGDGNGGDSGPDYSPVPGGSLETAFTEDQPYYVNPITNTPIDLGFMGDPMGAILAGRPFLEPSNVPLYMGGLPDVAQYPLETYYNVLVNALSGGGNDDRDPPPEDCSNPVYAITHPLECLVGPGLGDFQIQFPSLNLNVPGLGDMTWLFWLMGGGLALLLAYKWATKKPKQEVEIRYVEDRID